MAAGTAARVKRPRERSGVKIPDKAATVRKASVADAERIAALCDQLGYPAKRLEVARRLAAIRRDPDHAVFVVEDSSGRVAGWVHIGIGKWLESAGWAEVGGLVIDDEQRGRGLGSLLMQWAERWAKAHGMKYVRLRSNVVRKDAHRFYRKLGYEITKTQHAFQKIL
jgi:GNAT superfamily N-acetyltransferase